jgi:predicted small secreted protein
MKRAALTIVAVMLGGLVLAGCEQSTTSGADPTKGANAERYARDRQACLSQVDDYTRTRRRVDDSRRDVFSDPNDRFGRSALPDTMANYGDNQSSDRMVERCLAARGWAVKQDKSLWERITGS